MGSPSALSTEIWQYQLEQKALNDTLQTPLFKGADCSVFIEQYLHCQACIDYVLSVFNLITDETQRSIVIDKLLNRLTFSELSEKYAYSDRHIRRLYLSGLEELRSKGFEFNKNSTTMQKVEF